ncbi:MAG: PH domain-containing protein [Burkholderiaceae bacterium]
MLKKLASEALGMSDIGVVVDPKDFAKVDADDYLFHEDGEKVFFLIKSKKDEYCFTNLALIHVDGDSAVSSKRVIKRYEYASEPVNNITIETAGKMDMDAELKFSISGLAFSIDVKKSFLEKLKDIYKVLIAIQKRQDSDASCRENAGRVLEATSSMYRFDSLQNDTAVVQQFNDLLKHYNGAVLGSFKKRDFTDVFEKYIAR